MESDDLNCPLCDMSYDESNFTPRLLPDCGHTFCTKCLTELLEKLPENTIFTCPEDNIEITTIKNKEINSFPKNYALIRLIEKKKKSFSKKSISYNDCSINDDSMLKKIAMLENFENEELLEKSNNNPISEEKENSKESSHSKNMCKYHSRPLEVICLDHKERICTNCALFGMHKGHCIKTEEEVLLDVTNTAEKLLEIFNNLEEMQNVVLGKNWQSEAGDKIFFKVEKLKKDLNEKHESNIRLLNQKKNSVLKAIESFSEELNGNKMKEIPKEITEKLYTWKSDVSERLDSFAKKSENNEISFELIESKSLENNPEKQGEKLLSELQSFKRRADFSLEESLKNAAVKFDENFKKNLENYYVFSKFPEKSSNFQRISFKNKEILQEKENLKENLKENIKENLKEYMKDNFKDNLKDNLKENDLEINNLLNFDINNFTITEMSDFSILDLKNRDSPRILSENNKNFNKENIENNENYNKNWENSNKNYENSNKNNENSNKIYENSNKNNEISNKNNEKCIKNNENCNNNNENSYKNSENSYKNSENSYKNSEISNKSSEISNKNNDFSKKNSENIEILNKTKDKSNESCLLRKLNNSCENDVSTTSVNISSYATNKIPPKLSKKRAIGLNFKIPEKFEGVVEGLKNCSLEIVDFTSAELGDNGISYLSEHFCSNNHMKSLKLLKNKLSDEGLTHLLKSLSENSSLQSLNLSQNNLTENSLDVLFNFLQNSQKKNIKLITLNGNLMSLRQVKGKIAEFKKIGITITV